MPELPGTLADQRRSCSLSLAEVNRLVDRLLEVALKKRVFQVEISDDPKVFRQVGGEQFVGVL